MPKQPLLTDKQLQRIAEKAADPWVMIFADEPGTAVPWWRVWFDLGGDVMDPKTETLLRVRNPHAPEHRLTPAKAKKHYRGAYRLFERKAKEARRVFQDHRTVREAADADEVSEEIHAALHNPYLPEPPDDLDHGYEEDYR